MLQSRHDVQAGFDCFLFGAEAAGRRAYAGVGAL